MPSYCVVINSKYGKNVQIDIRGVEHFADPRYGEEEIMISNTLHSKKEAINFIRQLNKLASHSKDFFQIMQIHWVYDKFCKCIMCRNKIKVKNPSNSNCVFIKI